MDCEKEVRKAKRINYTAFGILVTVVLAIIIASVTYHYQHTFSTSKWANDIYHRYRIVSDLQEKYSLIGMTERQVIELLGQEDGKNQTSFKISKDDYPAESTLVYFLGIDIMDNMWLILPIENGVVVGITEDIS